jgi:DNA-binding transcriptional ArsR family regulator
MQTGTRVANSLTIAQIGAVLGDMGRAAMLSALLEGRALTARELADCAGITPQTASTHIARLVDAGLIRAERQGRHHYHRLASPDIAHMIEAMHVAGAGIPTRMTRRIGPSDEAMRLARSCYDHLAGRLGVALADSMAQRHGIHIDLGGVHLTETGAGLLTDWGIDVPSLRAGKRAFCRTCIDWSERRAHLAGALGAAILERSLALGWVRRRSGTRALALSPGGQLGFAKVFGVKLETGAGNSSLSAP